MQTISRSMLRPNELFLGALLMLICWEGIEPAATQPIPPADHESILYALRYAGLSSAAAALDAIIINKRFLVPPSATILIPTNPAMEPLLEYSDDTELLRVMSYHIIAENYPFDELRSFPEGTLIPTLLANNTLLVTHNNPSSFQINDHEFMPTDLCTIQTVACYAVNAIFDSATWGKANIISAAPPIPGAVPPAGAPILPPPGFPLPPVGAPALPPSAPQGAPIAPPVSSPLAPPVPAGAPAVFPPPGSPGGAPVPPGAPGTPGSSPPGTPSEAVMASTSSMSVAAAALMVSILVV